MLLKTLRYDTPSGWSEPLPSGLNSPATLVLAFGASGFADRPEPFAELARALPDAVLLGCSTSGEIAGAQVHDASISVAVARFEHTSLRRAVAEVRGAQDSWAAGARLAQQLRAPGLRAVFVLSDGLQVNGTPLVAGLTQNLPQDVMPCPVDWPATAAASRAPGCWTAPCRRSSASARWVSTASGCAWATATTAAGGISGPSGASRDQRATCCSNSTASRRWTCTRPTWASAPPACRARRCCSRCRCAAKAAAASAGAHHPRRRRSARSLTFAGDMPQGGIARLMRTHNDHLIDSAGLAVHARRRGCAAGAAPLVVSVSCVGRRLVLGERTDEEVETVVEGAPCGAGHVGFYSYGEIAPALAGGGSDLHNQTMTVTVFSEAAAASAAA